MNKVIILHNEIKTGTADELDVLNQKALVAEACSALGNKVLFMTLGNDVRQDIKAVVSEKPDLVFNLVESLWGKGELIYFAPALLNAYRIPYTGVPLDALFLTSSKVLAKKKMLNEDLPTAPFFLTSETAGLEKDRKYIVKPVWEEASVGISGDQVFSPSDAGKVEKISRMDPRHYFIEEFIDGREFNVSIIAGEEGPEVLPPAEMIFSGYFDNKPKIAGYKAKWDEESDEYKNTRRSFDTVEKDTALGKKLEEICIKSWKAFNLHGYARIDFREDSAGNIYILDINGNPCISPDSGFIAASHKAGYSEKQLVGRILKDLN